MHTIASKIQPWGSAPTTSCLVDNLHLPVDVALGLASHTIMGPNTSKFIQKLRECNKWAHEKAKEAKGTNEIMIKEIELQPWRLGTWS